jgi:hypothetical protein
MHGDYGCARSHRDLTFDAPSYEYFLFDLQRELKVSECEAQ